MVVRIKSIRQREFDTRRHRFYSLLHASSRHHRHDVLLLPLGAWVKSPQRFFQPTPASGWVLSSIRSMV